MLWLLLILPGLLLGLCTIAALIQANRCARGSEAEGGAEPEPAPLRLASANPSFRA